MPLYYRCITVVDCDLALIVNFLSRNKKKGEEIRTLLASHHCKCTESFHKLLSLAPNLQRLSTSWWRSYSNTELFDWQALSIVAETAGPRLVELAINLRRPSQPKTPDVFYQFTALKHLDIVSSLVLTYDPVKVKKNALPNLESITSLMTSDTFLLFLSNMECVLGLTCPHAY
jgi:hypothetical protein